jgi:hypothetical protein
MPRRPERFHVVEKTILGDPDEDGTLLGVVKVQMPDQCGADFKIRRSERERNMSIVQNAVARFGNWGREVNAPAIILFPEFSVSVEATAWLTGQMSSEQIAPNTLIALGMEQMATDEFMMLVANSDSHNDFDGAFGPNIDLINTAVVLAKDNDGNVATFFQPKCSRSDYESLRQFVSRTVNLIQFGPYQLVVSVCSDFLLRDENGEPLIGALASEIDRLHARPRDHRLDLVLLIQKNFSPLHDLYEDAIECLFRNRPHHLDTSNTIICAVNAADQIALARFGRCNVSVMNRGRAPKEMKRANETFAWCSFKDNGNLRFVRWRLREPGVISFVLDTDHRPWQIGDPHSLPIPTSGLSRLTEAGGFEEVVPIPEVYEIQDVLYRGFDSFINENFRGRLLRRHFGSIGEYERMLSRLFARRPDKIIRLLLLFHGVSANCDTWEAGQFKAAFSHFLLTLRLLSERYDDLHIPDDYLEADGVTMGVVDCNERSSIHIVDELMMDPTNLSDLKVVLLQRISKLFLWDGRPTNLQTLKDRVSVNRAGAVDGAGESVSRAPSPKVVAVKTVVENLNNNCANLKDIRRVLNDSF